MTMKALKTEKFIMAQMIMPLGLVPYLVLLEYFKNNPPKHSVILAAFDAEELGIEGSKYYVNNSYYSVKTNSGKP